MLVRSTFCTSDGMSHGSVSVWLSESCVRCTGWVNVGLNVNDCTLENNVEAATAAMNAVERWFNLMAVML